MPLFRARRASVDAVRRGRAHAERGQGLTEFALIVPLMFQLAVEVGDFGRLFNAAVSVTYDPDDAVKTGGAGLVE